MTEHSEGIKSCKRKHKLLKIASITSLILVLVILFAPLLVSIGPVKDFILKTAEDKTGATIAVSKLRLSWGKGAMLEGISFADADGKLIVDAGKLYIKASLLDLAKKRLDVRQCLLSDAVVTIMIDEREKGEKGQTQKALEDAVVSFLGTTQNAYSTAGEINPEIFYAINKIQYFRINLSNCAVVAEVIKPDGAVQSLSVTDIEGRIKLNPPGTTSGVDIVGRLSKSGSPVKLFALLERKPILWSLKEVSAMIKASVMRLDLANLTPFLRIIGFDYTFTGEMNAEFDFEANEGLVKRSSLNLESSNLTFGGSSANSKRLNFANTKAGLGFSTDENFINIDKFDCSSECFSFNVSGQIPKDSKSMIAMMDGNSKADLDGFFNIDLPKIFEMARGLVGPSDFVVTKGTLAGKISTDSLGEGKILFANINLVDFAGETDGKLLELSPIKLTGEILSRDEQIWIDPIQITSKFGTIRCSGPYKDLSLNGVLKIGDLQDELRGFIDFGEYKAYGEVNIIGDIMPNEKIFIGALQAKDFMIDDSNGKEWIDPCIDLTFGFKNEPLDNKLWLTSLFLSSDYLGQFELLQGYYDYGPLAVDQFVMLFNYKNTFEKIDFLLSLFKKLDDSVEMTGRFATTSKIAKRKGDIGIFIDETSFEELNIKKEQSLYSIPNFNMSASLDWVFADKILKSNDSHIRNQWLDIAFNNLNLDLANVDNIVFDSNLNLIYDLDFMKITLSDKVAADFSATGKRSMPVTISTHFSAKDTTQILKNMTADIPIGFDSLSYKGLYFGKSQINTKIEDGVFEILPVALDVNEGKVNLSLRADLKETPIMISLPQKGKLIDGVMINNVLADQLLRYISPIFANSLSCKGRFHFTCDDFSMPASRDFVQNLLFNGSISSDLINADPAGVLRQILQIMGKADKKLIDYQIKPVVINLKNGNVSYNDMVISIDRKDFSFSGNIGLDGSLGMEIGIPYSFSGFNLVESTGKPGIFLPLSGTLSEPKVDTRKLLQRNTESLIRSGLEEGLRKLLE